MSNQTLNTSCTVCSELDVASSAATLDSDICIDEPTLDEVMSAVNKLKNGRVAGCDGISHNPLKCGLPHVAEALHSLFQPVWRSGRLSVEWKDGIISLYKGKGPKNECSSYKPISLLSVPGKRIQPLLQMTQLPQQSGFTAGRSTVDAILTLRLLSELHRQSVHYMLHLTILNQPLIQLTEMVSGKLYAPQGYQTFFSISLKTYTLILVSQ